MYQGKTPQMCTERDSVTSTKKNLEDLVKLILKNLNICFIMKKNVSFSFGNLSRKVEFKNILDAYTFFCHTITRALLADAIDCRFGT